MAIVYMLLVYLVELKESLKIVVVETLFSVEKISHPKSLQMFSVLAWTLDMDIVSQQLIYVCLIMFMCYTVERYMYDTW